jgi:hypothetical protein
MNYVICSYKRPLLIKQRTLALLQRHKIEPLRVFVFVGGSDDDYNSYKYLTDEGYNLVRCPTGLAQARNSVADYFEEGAQLVCLDDDLRDILHLKKGEVWNLDEEFARGFQLAAANGCRLVGLYPVANRLWMSNRALTGILFCYGCCYGVINTKELVMTLSVKEDWERTLWFSSKDGAVVRLEYLAPLQNHRTESGGLDEVRTHQLEAEEAQALFLQNQDKVYLIERKGWPELRVKRLTVSTRKQVYSLPES